MTNPRYRAGFEHGVRCGWTDVFPPGVVPVVDMHGPFAFGGAVAFCEDRKTAETVAAALNRDDEARTALKSVLDHWDEFGPEAGLDETMHHARRALTNGGENG